MDTKVAVFEQKNESKSPLGSLIFVGMGILHPSIPLFLKLLFFKAHFRLDRVLISGLVIITAASIGLLNSSLIAMGSWFYLGIFVLYHKQIKSEKTLYSVIPLFSWFSVSLFLGFMFPVWDEGELRIGFYGGEPNFTGFYLLIFALSLFQRNMNKIGYCVIAFAALITLSRTAFVAGILIFIMKEYLPRKGIKKFFYLVVPVVFLGGLAIYFNIFDSTGYVFGYKRLYQFNDSSSLERVSLIVEWSSLLFSDGLYFLIGYPPEIINDFYSHHLVVHNSFILRAVTTGIIYTAIIVFIAFRILPREVFVILMVYCLLLHTLLSLPLIVILALLFGNRKRIFK
jgi:hypothetical protein